MRLVADLTWGGMRQRQRRDGREARTCPGLGHPGVRPGAWVKRSAWMCVCVCESCAYVCMRASLGMTPACALRVCMHVDMHTGLWARALMYMACHA